MPARDATSSRVRPSRPRSSRSRLRTLRSTSSFACMAKDLAMQDWRRQARDMDTDHHTHWETRYAEKPRIWSGRPNTRLAEIVGGLIGSRALDLGCGEGGDAMWLAEHGWQVVAVDVSTTALARAAEDAEARGVLGHIDFQQHDLTKTLPDGPFDLVSAHFFHTTLEMDRLAILRRAAATVTHGGTLLIVDHGDAPPWAVGRGSPPRVPGRRGGAGRPGARRHAVGDGAAGPGRARCGRARRSAGQHRRQRDPAAAQMS